MAARSMRQNGKPYKPRASRPLGERLEECIARDELTGCWIWIGNIGTNGYGRISVDNKLQSVHRVAYEFYRGQIPPGLVLMHTCDVRCCINPDHLVPGTKLENTADMMAKGRNKWWSRPGASNPAAKVSEDVVRHIRAWTMTAEAYAEMYGLNRTTVSRIRNGHTWTNVPV